MVGSEYYKHYIKRLINFNPTTISITRIEKIDNGRKGFTTKEISITETVTFYERKARREVVTDIGSTYVGVTVDKILAKGNSDILKNDTFLVNAIKYRVLFVKPYFDICKQIELEVIE